MRDFSVLMDSVPLVECKKEIDSQFESIAHHENVMKLAVLVSFIMNDTITLISKINSDKFIESLKTELSREVKEAETLKANQGSYMEHFEKNQELLTNFEVNKQAIQNISENLDRLLKEYDSKLSEMADERNKLSIAEIEAYK